MKILQVSHGLPPKEAAGVELYTFHLSRALERLGQEVHIFCREADPGREEFSIFEDEVDGLRVTRAVNNLKSLPDLRAYYQNAFFDRSFSRVLGEVRPDVVHFQHIFGLSASLVRIAKEEGYPVLFTLHDFFLLCHRIHLLKADDRLCPGPLYGLECASCLGFSPHPQDTRTRFILRMKDKLPFPAVKWLKRFFIPGQCLEDTGYEVFHRYRYIYEILKNPDILLAPSRFVQDLFLKYYPFIKPRMRILTLGLPPIDTGDHHQSESPDGRIRFCYFGNILPLKGLHVLIEALKGIPEEKYILTIYGARTPWNHPYYDLLTEKASGLPVSFYGPFDRDRLTEILSNQDVVILPSICYESFSFVIREAIQLGLPVIASKIGAIPEAIEEGVNGFLFNPGDPKDLRKWMLGFIEKPELIQTMASKKREAKSMVEHAAELIDLYQGVIQTSDHRP